MVRNVVIAAVDGVELLDVAGPAAVFHAASQSRERRGHPPAYRVVIAAPGSQIQTSGIRICTSPFDRTRMPVDTLLVGGAFDFIERRFARKELRPFLSLARRARRVGSVCTGAFILAELGVLDGRRATTHWLAIPAFTKRYSRVRVVSDAIYVKDGKYYTSAGVSAGIDLALALVSEDLGHEVAVEVARMLVVFLHRPGGQSQFSTMLRHQAADDDRIRSVQVGVIDDPASDHRLQTLARRAHMSERNFIRAFTHQTGLSPGRFVRRARLESSQQRLQTTDAQLEVVASNCGFGSAEVLRRAFLAQFGVTPSDYRARFRARQE